MSDVFCIIYAGLKVHVTGSFRSSENACSDSLDILVCSNAFLRLLFNK